MKHGSRTKKQKINFLKIFSLFFSDRVYKMGLSLHRLVGP